MELLSCPTQPNATKNAKCADNVPTIALAQRVRIVTRASRQRVRHASAVLIAVLVTIADGRAAMLSSTMNTGARIASAVLIAAIARIVTIADTLSRKMIVLARIASVAIHAANAFVARIVAKCAMQCVRIVTIAIHAVTQADVTATKTTMNPGLFSKNMRSHS